MTPRKERFTLLFLATLLACRAPPTAERTRALDARVQSNVLRSDYAGSAVCATCHPAEAERWARSPMHRMTRLPGPQEIRAPFDGRTYRYKDDAVTLWSTGGERFMRLLAGGEDTTYRITRVIGGRYREDYAGIAEGAAANMPADELILPVSYVYATGTFRPKGYSVMSPERPGLRAGPVWSRTCIFCHNTAPLLSTALGGLRGAGAASYQGEQVDPLLPPDRRVVWLATDAQALRAALDQEERFLGAPAPPSPPGADLRGALDAAIAATRERMDSAHLVELGIGCEACHGGSAEHAADPSLAPSDEPVAPWLAVRGAGGKRLSRAEASNRICARCHQVLFSRYAYTWEGGLRARQPGGSHINSGEARDFLLGACSRQLTCTACHDPHGEDTPEALARLRTPAGNPVCTRCHGQLAGPAQLTAHARHRADGPAGACLNCHLPRKNLGLGYQLTGYHRIGSPTDPDRVEHDRPLECALCHPERTTAQLLTDIERLWGRRYDLARLNLLYGGLDRPTLLATVEQGHPHEQATALAALGEQRVTSALPTIASQLTHPYPLVRYFSLAALRRSLPSCAVDLDLSAEQIRAQGAACLAAGAGAPRAP